MIPENIEIYGVAWVDLMLGPLTLRKNTADEARASAEHIRAHGVGKVENVRAVGVTADNKLVDLT